MRKGWYGYLECILLKDWIYNSLSVSGDLTWELSNDSNKSNEQVMSREIEYLLKLSWLQVFCDHSIWLLFYSVGKGVLGTLQLKAANLRTYEHIIERLKDLLVDGHMARAISVVKISNVVISHSCCTEDWSVMNFSMWLIHNHCARMFII